MTAERMPGPDFNTEDNLHADTVAERYDIERHDVLIEHIAELEAALYLLLDRVESVANTDNSVHEIPIARAALAKVQS